MLLPKRTVQIGFRWWVTSFLTSQALHVRFDITLNSLSFFHSKI